jgi:hypothetical protein
MTDAEIIELIRAYIFLLEENKVLKNLLERLKNDYKG